MTVKVLYILSSGHSGSTILGNVLGELDGFFHAGELRLLWRMGLLGESRCGCGLPVRDCPLWAKVVEETFDGTGSLDVRQVLGWQDALNEQPLGHLLEMDGPSLDRSGSLGSYAGVVSRLYEAIARNAGARVVVDSTKREDNAALLHLLPSIEPYIVHLVRDPRAVIYSWSRKERGAGHAHRLPTPGALGWLSRNRAAAEIRTAYEPHRSILVRYEDFVRRPRQTILAIAELVGERLGSLPLVGERTVRLATNHTAGGNRMRFTGGDIELRADDRWLTEQRWVDRLLTTGLTLPMLRRYGYAVGRRPTADGRG